MSFPKYRLFIIAALISAGSFLNAGVAYAHVRLNSPNGGENLVVGSRFTIEWEVIIEHSTQNWILSYSTAGASGPWTEITTMFADGDNTAGSIHTYDWSVPDDVSNTVRVRVIMDNFGADYEDISDADLAISPGVAEPAYRYFLLDSRQAGACAGTGSDARGFGVAVLNADQTQLSVYIEHDVANPTDAHIHFGPECVNGSAVYTFASVTSPIEGTWALSGSDVTDFLGGDLYVQIHSSEFPSGEIRGQIVAEPIPFLFTIDESQADAGSGTGSFASGYGSGKLMGDGSEFTLHIEHDIDPGDIQFGHLHFAPPDINGGVVFTFSDAASPIDETWAIDTASAKNLLGGRLYANIHTVAFPAGEIRGQVVRDEFRYAVQLKEADAGNGEPHGFCVVSVNGDLDEMSIYCEHDGTEIIAGHIHYGDSLTDGPVAFPFSSAASPIDETWQFTTEDLDSLFDGLLYVNVHSIEYDGGQIRGQLVPRDFPILFSITESEADACQGTGSEATGDGTVILKSGGRELTAEITHSVANPTLAHIHFAPECINGGAVFPFSQATSPMMDIWYLTAADVIDLMRNHLYVNIHSDPFPAGEIRGQIGPIVYACGDSNGDGNINVGDAVHLIAYVFKGGPAPEPLTTGDANCDGAINVGDAVYLINFIFKGGAPACCL